ncbi:MAG: hypothetical protein SOV36_01340 [Anaerostipes faecalis]|nr:hypothetical protein [Anaerostipes faecalis]
MAICKNTSATGNCVASKMMVLEGSILFVPLIVLPFYREEAGLCPIFVIPADLSVIVGLFVCHYGGQIRNSNRFVVFAWFYGILLAAVPFLMYENVTSV